MIKNLLMYFERFEMKLTKTLFLMIFTISSVLLIQSCSESRSEDTRPQTSNNGDLALARLHADPSPLPPAAPERKANVYQMTSVKSKGANMAADFSWTENGKKMSFSELTKGKVVFVNFWGTWCPPCRKEIPAIVSIDKESGDDLVIIGIALEKTRSVADGISKVTSFAKSQGINYRNFIGSGEIIQAYGGIPAVPTTFIIDKKGKIAEKIVGGRSKAQFLQSINRAKK